VLRAHVGRANIESLPSRLSNLTSIAHELHNETQLVLAQLMLDRAHDPLLASDLCALSDHFVAVPTLCACV